MQPGGFGQIRLGLTAFGQTEIVEAQIRGDVGLIVAAEARAGLADVGPLGEARPPPFVILRNGVVLGQIKGQGADLCGQGHNQSKGVEERTRSRQTESSFWVIRSTVKWVCTR